MNDVDLGVFHGRFDRRPDFVSLAGTLYALLNNFTDPRALRWDQSGEFVIMAVMGGMRSFWGPLIGAAVLDTRIASPTGRSWARTPSPIPVRQGRKR